MDLRPRLTRLDRITDLLVQHHTDAKVDVIGRLPPASAEIHGDASDDHRIEIDQSLKEALQGAKFTHIFALDALYFVPDVEMQLRSLRDSLEAGGRLTMISHLYR